MSDITDSGDMSSKHDWQRLETFQWGQYESLGKDMYHAANTNYKCRKCSVDFTHWYHQVPNIYEALETENIPTECLKHV